MYCTRRSSVVLLYFNVSSLVDFAGLLHKYCISWKSSGSNNVLELQTVQ